MTDFLMELDSSDILLFTFLLVAFYVLTVRVLLPIIKITKNINTKIRNENLVLIEAFIQSYKEWLLSSKRNHSLKFVTKKMLEDKKFLLEFLIKNKESLSELDVSYLEDKDFLLILMGNIEYKYFKVFPKELNKDKEFILKALNSQAFFIDEVDESLKSDKEVGMLAVTKLATSYAKLDEELKKDNDIILATIKNSPTYFVNFNDDIKDNEKYVLESLISLENSEDRYKVAHAAEIIQSTSERIQKVCRCLDPIKALESAILVKEMNKSLTTKSDDRFKNLRKV